MKLLSKIIIVVLLTADLLFTLTCVSLCRDMQTAQNYKPEYKPIIKEKEATPEEKAYWEAKNKAEEEYKKRQVEEQKEQEELKRRNEIMASETTFPNITASGGVGSYGGLRFTWYGSESAPHNDKWKWHVDSRGFYRDSDGYIVIAYTMTLPYETVIQLGDNCWGKVKGHCPTPNTVDIYVNWG